MALAALGIFESTVERDGTGAATRLIANSFGVAATLSGKPGWVEMTPANMMWTTKLQEIVPDACFIHVVRDGRDVASSVADTWKSMDRDSALSWWVRECGPFRFKLRPCQRDPSLLCDSRT